MITPVAPSPSPRTSELLGAVMLMAGVAIVGGMKRGFVYGKTAVERPCVAIENPVTITDLHATLFTAMGISPKTVFDVENRPFYATEDGKGKPVDAVFV